MHPIRTEYGRDALNDTFGECVVAKANEADCGAQTPKSKHREEEGKLNLEFNIYSEISWLCRFFRFILLNLTCKNQG